MSTLRITHADPRGARSDGAGYLVVEWDVGEGRGAGPGLLPVHLLQHPQPSHQPRSYAHPSQVK